MNNELLQAKSPALNEPGIDRLDYHAPKFVSLGSLQSLVQSSVVPPSGDGGGEIDGTGSAP
jgi:hypothetical protein